MTFLDDEDHAATFNNAIAYEAADLSPPVHSLFERLCTHASVYCHDCVGMIEATATFLRARTQKLRPTRTGRFRPASLSSLRKNLLWMVPTAILLYFGVLHILEFIFGRAHLFFNPYMFDPVPQSFRFAEARAEPSRLTLEDTLPIPCHSHNDHWRQKPLVEALEYGCTSVEADVFLFDQQLYVGHYRGELERERTFQKLYVEPLVQLLDQQRTGSLRDGGNPVQGVFNTKPDQTLVLLVDSKSGSEDVYQLLQTQIQPLRDRNYLSYWNGDEFVSRQVTLVFSGGSAIQSVLEQSPLHRDMFYDAPLDALWQPPRTPIELSDPLHEADGKLSYAEAMSLPTSEESNILPPSRFPHSDIELYNASTSYYASTNFRSAVGQVWRGHLSKRQMNIIRGQIRGAKQRGLKVRYWGTPTWPISLRDHVWHVLVKEGVDVLNADDLRSAATMNWKIRMHRLWSS